MPGGGQLRVEGSMVGAGDVEHCSVLPALLAPQPWQTPAEARHRLLRSVLVFFPLQLLLRASAPGRQGAAMPRRTPPPANLPVASPAWL